jgi:hypothetical protein
MSLTEEQLSSIYKSMNLLDGWIRSRKTGWHSSRLFNLPEVFNRSKEEKDMLSLIVGYIIFLEESGIGGDKTKFEPSTVEDRLMIVYFKQIAEALVQEFYLEKAFHSLESDKYFFRELVKENLKSIDKIKGNKIETLRSIFEALYHREHPIRYNLFFLDSIPEIRQIQKKN